MNKDDIDTVLLAKKNYKIYLGSVIVTSILTFSGIGLLAGIERGPFYVAYMFFVLTASLTHVIGSAGFAIWRPLGKKHAPVPYNKLLSILENQLYKDVASIEYIATASKDSKAL